MKKTIILISIVGLVCVCGLFCFVNHAQAYTQSEYEQADNWFGNKFWNYNLNSVVDLSFSTGYGGQIFRCRNSQTVTNIFIHYASVSGWTTQQLRACLVAVDSTTGEPVFTYLGATGNGYQNFTPVAGWQNISLKETVDIVEGNLYFIGIKDVNSILLNTRYVRFTPTVNPSDAVKGRQPDGCYEPYDVAYIKSSTYTHNSWVPWAIMDTNMNIEGQPITCNAGSSVYATRCVHQVFNVTEDGWYDALYIMFLMTGSQKVPTSSLNYTLVYRDNQSVICSGVLANPLETKQTLVNYAMRNFTPVYLTTSNTYELNLTSSCTSAQYYTIFYDSTSATGVMTSFTNVSWHGDQEFFGLSTNDGVTWTDYPTFDMPFALRLKEVPSITINNVIDKATGSSVSIWNGTGYTINNTFTGNQSGLVLIENIVNAVGTHEYNWNPLFGVNGEWWVWANYTGTGGGSTGTSLLVDNPNPANNSINQTGIPLNNNLSTKLGGMSCGVDVTFQNFTNKKTYVAYLGVSNYYRMDKNSPLGDIITVGYFGDNEDFLLTDASVLLALVYIGDFPEHITNMTYKITTIVDDKPSDIILGSGIFDISGLSPTLFGEEMDWSWCDFYPYILLEQDMQFAVVLEPEEIITDYIIFWMCEQPWCGDSAYTRLMFYTEEEGWIDIDTPDAFGSIILLGWNNIVNLTFKSNSSGSWQQFGFVNALWNGTWSCFNANFTNASTTYYWSVTLEIYGTVYSEQFYTFTTGTNSSSQLIPLQSADYRYGLLVGSVGLIAFTFRKKKKEENRKKK